MRFGFYGKVVIAGMAAQIPHAAQILDYMQRISGFGYSGVMLVVSGNRTIVERGYGFANRSTRRPITPGTLFDIGSLSKQFTGAAVLHLEGEGKLHDGDTLGALLDSVPPDKRGITVRQLLSHTSGISQPYGPRAEMGHDAAIRRILAAPLGFHPGQRQVYSNAGYVLLAAIVQRVSGVSFREYVAANLFKPAGMTRTGFRAGYPPGITATDVALGYDEVGVVVDPNEWRSDDWASLGASQVVTTVGDLHLWLEAVAHGRVLKAAEQKKFLAPLTPDSGELAGYGYGLRVRRSPVSGLQIHHGGDAIAYGANMDWYPERGILIVSLCNVREDLYPTHILADEVVPKIIFGGKFPEPPHFSSLRSFNPRFEGTFVLASGGKLTITRSGDVIALGADGQDAVDVIAGGDSSDVRKRSALSQRTEHVVDAWIAGDTVPLSTALGGGEASEFGHAMDDEMREAAGSKPIRARTVMGTFPGGGPYGAQVTLLRLDFDGGSARYRFKWSDDVIWETSPRSLLYAAPMRLQPIDAHTMTGWDLSHSRGVSLELIAGGNRRDTIVVTSDGHQWRATRMSGS